MVTSVWSNNNVQRYWRAAHVCRLLFMACGLGLLGACSTAPVKTDEPAGEPIFPADRVLGEGVSYESDEIWDPLEGMNRAIYRFNYHFDRYIFLPGIAAYQYVTPDPVEKGIHNFFRNLTDVSTLINSILQLNLDKPCRPRRA